MSKADKLKQDQEREKLSSKIRQHNFNFHYVPKEQLHTQEHFNSVQKQANQNVMRSFDNREFASQRGSIQELKSYLQSTHLKIGSYAGGDTAALSTNKQASIDGLTASNGFNQQQRKQGGSHKPVQSMRTSSDIVFGRGKGDFETCNKGYYSWIQPKMLQ